MCVGRTFFCFCVIVVWLTQRDVAGCKSWGKENNDSMSRVPHAKGVRVKRVEREMKPYEWESTGRSTHCTDRKKSGMKHGQQHESQVHLRDSQRITERLSPSLTSLSLLTLHQMSYRWDQDDKTVLSLILEFENHASWLFHQTNHLILDQKCRQRTWCFVSDFRSLLYFVIRCIKIIYVLWVVESVETDMSTVDEK